MATSNLYVNVKCKYPRLLYWLNVPLTLLGFKPYAAGWMFEMSDIKHGPKL